MKADDWIPALFFAHISEGHELRINVPAKVLCQPCERRMTMADDRLKQIVQTWGPMLQDLADTDTSKMTVRDAAKRRLPLDGTDAQALEHALTITEGERDDALAVVKKAMEIEAKMQELQAGYAEDKAERERLDRSFERRLAEVREDFKGKEAQHREAIETCREGIAEWGPQNDRRADVCRDILGILTGES